MTSFGDRIGMLRLYQVIGQGYAEIFRGSLTASGIVTAGAAWLGMGKTGALLLGLLSLGFWLALAIVFGWSVIRWRVIHKTLDAQWRNDPFAVRQMDLLEAIERNTRR